MKKTLKIITLVMALSIIVTGCGKKAELKNGNKTAVSVKSSEITASNYYEKIKNTNIQTLVDMIDHELFDKKYPATDEENEQVKKQIEQIKSTYGANEELFKSVIKQYFGVESEKELENMLRLEYKRNQAIKDHVKDSLKDSEIKKYYNDNITGEIKASHILIKSNVKDDATSDEKDEAEKNALEQAKKIIKKLDKGEKFASLAKKYSDDESNKNNGGDLGYFDNDEMVEEFTKAVKDLKKNEYTKEPVKTEYGYHIILKTDEKKKPTLKSVKDEIKEKLTEEKLTNDAALHYNALIEIREKNKVKWNDKDLKKAYNEFMDQLIKSTEKSQN